MDVSDHCENSLQTLSRWFWSLLSTFAVLAILAVVIYGTVWLLVNMVAAVVIMVGGVLKSIRPLNDKSQTRAPVSRFTLHLCFYLLAVPMFALIFIVDDEPFVYTQRAWFLILVVSLWIPMRWLCDKLMRHTGSVGRFVTAALLAVVFTPVAARLIGLTEFYGVLCDGLRGVG